MNQQPALFQPKTAQSKGVQVWVNGKEIPPYYRDEEWPPSDLYWVIHNGILRVLNARGDIQRLVKGTEVKVTGLLSDAEAKQRAAKKAGVRTRPADVRGSTAKKLKNRRRARAAKQARKLSRRRL
ncbi:MAG: hypothetical protein V4451_04815 [Pseudomonadota bacterium]